MLRVLQAVCCAVVLLIAVPTYGQVTTGTFSGAVSDPNGATVLGATVTITNVATGVTVFTGTTDDQGLYLAPAIPVGIYNIVFEAPTSVNLRSAGSTCRWTSVPAWTRRFNPAL